MEKKDPVEEKTELLIEGAANIAMADERKFQELVETISLKEPAPRDREFAEGFLKVARDDIKAARILYDCRIYNLSVYHLEQAIEKMVKALLIMLGKLTSNDFCIDNKARTHESVKLIIKMFNEVMERIDKIHKEATGKQLIPKEEKRKFHKAFEVVKDLKEGRELMDLDNYFKEFLKGASVAFDNSMDYKQINKIIEEAYRTLENEDIPEELRVMLIDKRDVVTKEVADVAITVPLTVTLYMLSALTFPHEAFTRYPRCENEKAPEPWEYLPEKYNFVKEEHFILDVTEKCLNALEELMNRGDK